MQGINSLILDERINERINIEFTLMLGMNKIFDMQYVKCFFMSKNSKNKETREPML